MRFPGYLPKLYIPLLLAVATLIARPALAQGTAAPAVVPWDVERFREAPPSTPAPEVHEEGLEAVYLDGPSYQGTPTKVFALYGVPKVKEGQRVPGIVLVHGAGGTAFAYWVKLWNSRGYAAIAIDHGGNIPVWSENFWQKNANGGPPLTYWDTPQEIENQWMYHAVANSMLAVSFVQSLPGVDPDRIGLTGISWGGVVASTVAGLDERLKFVVPVYGCGFISEPATDGSCMLADLPPDLLARWRSLWDPANYLPKAKMPLLWVTGSNDAFFTMDSLQRSSRLAKGKQAFAIRLNMIHGHSGHGENPEEIRAFADSIVNGGKPLASIVDQGIHEDEAWCRFEAEAEIVHAELNYTTDQGRWQERQWATTPATINPLTRKVTARLPPQTSTFYFNLTDQRGLLVSSAHVSREMPESEPSSEKTAAEAR